MAIEKITEIMARKPRTLSFEFFPPKTPKGRDNLFKAAEELMQLQPDFFSVTYGAGGGTARNTLEIVEELQKIHDIPVMHHLTCTKHGRTRIREQLNEMMTSNVLNILALRGDPPEEEYDYQPGPDEPRYAFELVQLIRERADWFAIGVAAFPEIHQETPTAELDSLYTRIKQDVGADFAITQLFFQSDLYEQFLQRLREKGVTMRVIPGVLPITNFPKLTQFCQMCGASVPQEVCEQFDPIAEDLDATVEKGKGFIADHSRRLLELGAPGLHFYCLNRSRPVVDIVESLGDFRSV